MANSREMKEIYDALERICVETGEVLEALDDLMKKESYKPIGTALRWETSVSINYPKGWLPYFSQRMYRKDSNTGCAIGVNIMFKDPELNNKIFFISCGRIDGKNAGGKKSDEFYSAGWNKKSQLIPGTKLYYKSFEEYNICNYFIPLDNVKDLESLEKFVVKPLISLYDEESKPEKGFIVGEFAITLEEIKAD